MSRPRKLKIDEIGFWSEAKLQIIKTYAERYSRILSSPAQRGQGFTHVYIDAFAGAGVHISKRTGEIVPGSPQNALEIKPEFAEYFLIDLDQSRVENLLKMASERGNVHVYEGDCNSILLNEVFPKVRYEDYRRGLCLLDPYGMHLRWEVLAEAGRAQSIEIFLNFPVMDMNMNVLWKDRAEVDPKQLDRMDAFWGDSSWGDIAYEKSADLFGFVEEEKMPNVVIARAFQRRLREVAGFKFVPDPIPMRNQSRSELYYLFFASHNATGNKIAEYIFGKFRRTGHA